MTEVVDWRPGASEVGTWSLVGIAAMVVGIQSSVFWLALVRGAAT
jgi:hypothetical protein